MLHIELTEHKPDGTTTTARSRKTYRTMRGAQRLLEQFKTRYPEPRYHCTIAGEPEHRDNTAAIGQVHVGDIFHCGWGYDMTINDFYEVIAVSKSGKSVTVHKIATRMDGSPNDVGGATISPILTGDRFVGEPERHPLDAGSGRISIKIDGYRYAFLMEPEDYMQGYYENHLD